jgi:hypothetical protein
MVTRHDQGMGFWGWFLALGFGALVALAVVRVAPVYLEYYTVEKAVDNAAHALRGRGREAAERALIHQFQVNEFPGVHVRDIRIVRRGRGLVYVIDYTQRTPYLGNLGFWMHFHATVPIPRPER